MRILFYDCPAGISGDMNLAALIDLGVDPAVLGSELSKLGLDNAFALRIAGEARNGIRGTRVDVVLTGPPAAEQHHGHAHGPGHGHGHDRRNLAAIEGIIEASGLDTAVRRTSLAIFRRIAAAEAKVHGIPVEAVHFHEVGAVDSIVDIVGAAICHHILGVDAVWASPIELGGGFVRCAHGLLPVPAPATEELLHGIPTTRGAVDQEATTPTGAAILATLATRFTAAPAMVVEKTGYGIGHRQTELPNLLRVHLARVETATASPDVSDARLLQCNIDDMTAEHLGVVLDTLLDAGAMDVHLTPIIMKKSRPATCLSLLCAAGDEARFKELLFRHTTTLGLKSFALEKTVLETSFPRRETPLGPVTMKNALRDGKILHSKPELEECRELARRHDLPLTAVAALIGRGEDEPGHV